MSIEYIYVDESRVDPEKGVKDSKDRRPRFPSKRHNSVNVFI